MIVWYGRLCYNFLSLSPVAIPEYLYRPVPAFENPNRQQKKAKPQYMQFRFFVSHLVRHVLYPTMRKKS
jgi:hypothetical protein